MAAVAGRTGADGRREDHLDLPGPRRVHRCPGQIPGFACGPRETESRSHGCERPRAGIAGRAVRAPRSEPELHGGLGPRLGATGASDDAAPAVAGRYTRHWVWIRP